MLGGCARCGGRPTQMAITDMVDSNVVQPLLVTLSALTLATECVRQILKIDDIVRSSPTTPRVSQCGARVLSK